MPSPAPSPAVPADFTERLLRRFLLLCENPRTRRRALALVQGSVSNARAGRRFYALVNRVVLNPVARAMGVETSAVRMELVGSQLIGLAMIRYVLKVEPIASLSVDELVPLMAPPLRQALGSRRRLVLPLPARVTRSSPSSPGEPVDCRSTAGRVRDDPVGMDRTLPLHPLHSLLPLDQPFTPAMARAVGISSQALSRMLAAGLVRRVLRGVYVASTAAPPSPLRAAAVGLAARAARHRRRPDGCVGARRARVSTRCRWTCSPAGPWAVAVACSGATWSPSAASG